MEAFLLPAPPPTEDVLPCLACGQPLKPEDFHRHLRECERAWPSASSAALGRCKHCSRYFMPSRLAIHEKVCPIAQRKRPVFQQTQHSVLPKLPTTCKKLKNTQFAQKKWYKQHLSVLTSIRNGQNEHLYEDYIQCPTCQRRFAPHAADRHLALCRSALQKLPRPALPIRLKKSQSGAALLRQVARVMNDSRSATSLRHTALHS